MSSPPLSAMEPSLQSKSKSNYISVNNLEEDNTSNDLKFSLAHYFSPIFVVFIAMLLISTMVLFIWSNTSDGAWVSLQVTPIINKTHSDAYNAWFPLIFPFIAFDFNTNPKHYTNTSSLALLHQHTHDLNVLQYYFQGSDIDVGIPDLNDVNININIFHFSLVSSVSDFWQSQAYSLAILIAAFSGIWPYIKLILLMITWIYPMKQAKREGILIFLDQMGKFSFIDLFVSLYMIVSFYVSITQELAHKYGVNIKVVVEPDIGLNTFVIGTVISMIFSHFFLYLEAKYAKQHTREIQEEAINCVPLCVSYIPTSICHVFIRCIMLIVMLFTFYGSIYTVFTAPVRYNITGLVGVFISDSVRSYSPWQIVTQVPSHTDEHEAAPLLSFCLFLCIIWFPILLNVCIVIVWCIPLLKQEYRQYLNVAMQTSMSWCALDVFAVASIAASLELSRVSQWIINQNYASVCGDDGIIPRMTKQLFGTPIGCFSVDGSLTYGIYIVIAVALSQWILFCYTIHQLHQYKQSMRKPKDKDILDKSIFFFHH